MPAPAQAEPGDEVTYAYSTTNIGGQVDAFVSMPIPEGTEYVANSTFGGATLLPGGMSEAELAAIYAQGGREALLALATDAADAGGTIVWTGDVGSGVSPDDFGFKVKVMIMEGEIDATATVYDEGQVLQVDAAGTLTVAPTSTIHLPIVVKAYSP
jgi:uncharacterized repeat protein (TIGR01451 family)